MYKQRQDVLLRFVIIIATKPNRNRRTIPILAKDREATRGSLAEAIFV